MKKKRKKAESGIITAYAVCPECKRAVRVIPFGEGWVGTCCNKVVYNGRNPPRRHPADPAEDSRES